MKTTTLTGTLTHAGTCSINGEEVDGVFVAIPRDRLRAVPHLPMDQPVQVNSAEWIACATLMPPDRVEVLAAGPNWPPQTMHKGWEQGWNPDHWRTPGGQRIELGEITHWMPAWTFPPLPPIPPTSSPSATT